jgi:hypothetical protein
MGGTRHRQEAAQERRTSRAPRLSARCAVLCAAFALSLAVPAQATYLGQNGKIAFVKNGDVYVVNPNGTGLTNFTNSAGAEKHDRPGWHEQAHDHIGGDHRLVELRPRLVARWTEDRV